MEQHQSYYHLWYRGPRRRRDKGEENLFKKIIAENFNFRKKKKKKQRSSKHIVPKTEFSKLAEYKIQ